MINFKKKNVKNSQNNYLQPKEEESPETAARIQITPDIDHLTQPPPPVKVYLQTAGKTAGHYAPTAPAMRVLQLPNKGRKFMGYSMHC